MNRTILPADTYIVINKTIVDEIDRKLITMLYQPIIGYSAVALYFTLLDDFEKKDNYDENLIILNPGSTSIPKDGTHSVATIDIKAEIH